MIKPLGDRVLVKPKSPDAKSAGGLILKREQEEKQDTGTVLAVGEGEEITKYNLKKGDTVLYQKYGPTYFTKEKEDYVVVFIDEIVGVER